MGAASPATDISPRESPTLATHSVPESSTVSSRVVPGRGRRGGGQREREACVSNKDDKGSSDNNSIYSSSDSNSIYSSSDSNSIYSSNHSDNRKHLQHQQQHCQ